MTGERSDAPRPSPAVDPWALVATLTQAQAALRGERDALIRQCATLAQQHAEATAAHDQVRQELERAQHHLREYQKLHDLTVMELERWRRHLFGHKAERLDTDQRQLVFEVLRQELDQVRQPEAEKKAREAAKQGTSKKRGPRAARQLDLDHLPCERIELTDLRVLAEPERWVRVSEETSTKLEFRRASFVRLEIVRPIWVRRDAVAEIADAVRDADAAPPPPPPAPPRAPVARVTIPTTPGAPVASVTIPTTPGALVAPVAPPAVGTAPVRSETPSASLPTVVTATGTAVSAVGARVPTTMPRVITAPLLEHPIPRCLAGPALLAHVLVSRFADHLPYARLAKRFAREGVKLADSTIGGWVEPCAKLLGRVVDAMLADAIAHAPWIAIDPTGVLVQQKEKCRRGFFWVMVAAQDHVFFRYTPKQNGEVPRRLLKDYKGYVQADAASVYHALFELGTTTEVGCQAHARRRFYDARTSDPERALTAIGFIHQLYAIDDETRAMPLAERTKERAARAGPVLTAYKAWLDKAEAVTLPRSPIGEAIRYTLNQWVPLTRFVEDGRLRLDNNHSERELRAIAVGRKNWIFVGTDEYGEHAAVIVSLIASCRLHQINPETYLRDVLLLINTWPAAKVIQLAPKYWNETRAALTADQKAILASWPH